MGKNVWKKYFRKQAPLCCTVFQKHSKCHFHHSHFLHRPELTWTYSWLNNVLNEGIFLCCMYVHCWTLLVNKLNNLVRVWKVCFIMSKVKKKKKDHNWKNTHILPIWQLKHTRCNYFSVREHCHESCQLNHVIFIVLHLLYWSYRWTQDDSAKSAVT